MLDYFALNLEIIALNSILDEVLVSRKTTFAR